MSVSINFNVAVNWLLAMALKAKIFTNSTQLYLTNRRAIQTESSIFKYTWIGIDRSFLMSCHLSKRALHSTTQHRHRHSHCTQLATTHLFLCDPSQSIASRISLIVTTARAKHHLAAHCACIDRTQNARIGRSHCAIVSVCIHCALVFICCLFWRIPIAHYYLFTNR